MRISVAGELRANGAAGTLIRKMRSEFAAIARAAKK